MGITIDTCYTAPPSLSRVIIRSNGGKRAVRGVSSNRATIASLNISSSSLLIPVRTYCFFITILFTFVVAPSLPYPLPWSPPSRFPQSLGFGRVHRPLVGILRETLLGAVGATPRAFLDECFSVSTNKTCYQCHLN